ncbi:MAG: aminotransferase class I/II-fold pyridoxal phosphate-dependent enzyme [candidate division KSB1 bacterium]|nr:aminotransferase class I/II-fold pyridoxal phosphate-dependent enzyme [candidate division KSB1 bacterium]
MRAVQDPFRLKPVETAEVSEISELTASAQVRREDRVNFHIGNPVQDPRLLSMYQRLILGLAPDNGATDPREWIEEHVESRHQAERVHWFLGLVEKSVAYLPRGGFGRRDPGSVARKVHALFTSEAEEPLDYDLGDKSGKREITFVSGGKREAVRLLHYALSRQLEVASFATLLFGFPLPQILRASARGDIIPLPDQEGDVLRLLRERLRSFPDQPHFLLLGRVPTEGLRRAIRRACLEGSLFVVEANGAANHLSLAREAGLANRVLRILDAADLRADLQGLAVAVVLGRADYIDAIEKAHFELKGTPAAPELEFLGYLLNQPLDTSASATPVDGFDLSAAVPEGPRSSYEGLRGTMARVPSAATRVARHVEEVIERLPASCTSALRARHWTVRAPVAIGELHVSFPSASVTDAFPALQPTEIIEQLFTRYADPLWRAQVVESFLSAFLQLHPEYEPEACAVVGGSARTALALLGRYCGLEEAIVPDLSWTYHHCFPRVTAVPLTADFQLDVEGILREVDGRLEADRSWAERGAVVINSPHNASGQIFHQGDLVRLLRELLGRGVWVVDDLSYKGVAPQPGFVRTYSLREIATAMVRQGELRREHLRKLITVHSLSKTDCFAGGRLAVVEILDPALRSRFRRLLQDIAPNLVSCLLAYLFYRNGERIRAFWELRNRVLWERLEALDLACAEVPAERNPYSAKLVRPTGSMYPRLEIERLPEGVSLVRLATGLAVRGIGLVPLSAFARTASGWELARRSFRLTLGGDDPAPVLARKIRRVLIDLNRLIAQEAEGFRRRTLPRARAEEGLGEYSRSWANQWAALKDELESRSRRWLREFARQLPGTDETAEDAFVAEYLPERLAWIRQRLVDRARLADEILWLAQSDRDGLLRGFAHEIRFPELDARRAQFRSRLFDRTVHPTQMYALEVERLTNRLVDELRRKGKVSQETLEKLAASLAAEHLGLNVAIRSAEESWELVVDLDALAEAEQAALFWHGVDLPLVLSYWGDWDGSTRPSGQGHRLVAGALLENVSRLRRLVKRLRSLGVPLDLPAELEAELQGLERKNREFWKLLDEITKLTSQLEQRYRSVLPIGSRTSPWRRLGMRLGVAKDPMTVLWLHNDRLEKRMLRLRARRRESLKTYFELNEELHRTLQKQLERIREHLDQRPVAEEIGHYRSLLRRFFLTPRIHQRMVLAVDQFAVDTTVHNMVEINALAGAHGFPGLVLALQVSMSTDPEAVIALDRKLRAKSEELLRRHGKLPLPSIWIIPLFEDLETVRQLEGYLDRLWEYAVQSRRLGQSPADRFAELTCELFVAGSDLSQQVSQPAGYALYREAKYRAIRWFAEKELVGRVRIKLGSGEPAQRQGGYFDPTVGQPVARTEGQAYALLSRNFNEVERQMLRRATEPLRGAMAGGEFRTFQSNLFERLRLASAEERAQFFFHVLSSQRQYEGELQRAASSLVETRFLHRERGLQELEALTLGRRDEHLRRFLEELPQHFRQILYGSEEDIIGLHVISYFVSRTMPPLRDRPVVRPGREPLGGRGREIVGRIAETLPLAKHGSLLRAIGHNRAQTMILGVNQLTTGLFRCLKAFIESFDNPAEGWRVVEDSILPHLPVYDILHTLRLYHDLDLEYVRRLEGVFPPGNSALLALREDNDAIREFIPSFQRELLRRCGLESEGFFTDGHVRRDLLPLLRPELVVLLQPDLFNTDYNRLVDRLGEVVDSDWGREVGRLLEKRDKVRMWRARIWDIIEGPVRSQVESFVQLAQAVNRLTAGGSVWDSPFAANPGEVLRLGAQVASLLRGAADDMMRQFLIAAVQYLTQLPQGAAGVPIEVIRALRNVERIVMIEEQALNEKQLALVRFCTLQIARLCGENG